MTAFWIILAVLLILSAVSLLMNVFGGRARLTGKYDRLLERASEQGLVIPAEVLAAGRAVLP